jgi:hypothetical protein
MIFSIITLMTKHNNIITTLRIMIFSIIALNKITLSITTLRIMTFSMTTRNITTLCITTLNSGIQHDNK